MMIRAAIIVVVLGLSFVDARAQKLSVDIPARSTATSPGATDYYILIQGGAVKKVAGTSVLYHSKNLSDLANVATSRTNLGLTSLATTTPGTGNATALAIAVGSTGAFLKNNGDAMSGTYTGAPTFSGNLTFSGDPLFTGLANGTQDRCLGLTSGNTLVTSTGACGSGGGGGGDVVGPASSTNNRVAAFDGATGKLLKDSGILYSNLVVSGGAMGTPSSGTGTNITGIPNNNVLATTLAAGTTVSLTGPRQYYVCTGTCSVTPPVPAGGYEFCVMNANNQANVITLAALGGSVKYENTARTAYGTTSTGTLVSSGAVGDKVCIVGLNATTYLTVSYAGSWVAN